MSVSPFFTRLAKERGPAGRELLARYRREVQRCGASLTPAGESALTEASALADLAARVRTELAGDDLLISQGTGSRKANPLVAQAAQLATAIVRVLNTIELGVVETAEDREEREEAERQEQLRRKWNAMSEQQRYRHRSKGGEIPHGIR